MNEVLPNIQPEQVDLPSLEQLQPKETSVHKPRILLLYGSTRERSFSRLNRPGFRRHLYALNRGPLRCVLSNPRSPEEFKIQAVNQVAARGANSQLRIIP